MDPFSILFAFAIETAGYAQACNTEPEKCGPPAVVYASEGMLRKAAGGHVKYARSPNLVVIQDSANRNSLHHDAMLVHEFVHVLQWRFKRHQGSTYCNRADREAEATQAQQAYALSKGWRYKHLEGYVESFRGKCEAARIAGLVK